MNPSRRRGLRRALLVLATLMAGYVALLLYPQPLFAYSHVYRQFVVYSDQPLPNDQLVDALIDQVNARLLRSPLYDLRAKYHVFLCQRRWRFALLANSKYRAAGFQSLVGRNVFLRRSSITHDRLFGPSGAEVGGDRTLTYYIAHELTHTLTLDALGRIRYALLPRWQREGYADFVAKPQFDVAAARADLAARAERMDFERSGLYDGFHLQVIDALAKGMSIERLLGIR